MASSSIVESVYGRAVSFGRDVFQYIVTGTMFAIVCSVPWWSKYPPGAVLESSQIALLLAAAAIPIFGLGHVLLTIGFWIRKKIIRPTDTWCDKLGHQFFVLFSCCHLPLRDYKCAVKCAKQALPGSLVVGNESPENVHLGLEMSVFLEKPELHAVFIERYNTLWHLRLGLAASFLMAGVVNLAFVIFSLCLPSKPFPGLVGVVVVVSILLGRLLLRQHLVTHTNFLRRVIVAFNIRKERDA